MLRRATMFIYGYKFGSKSVKNLSVATGVKRIKHENSKFKGGAHKSVLNWGATALPREVLKCTVYNKPENVRMSSNKLMFFDAVKNQGLGEGPRVPQHSTSTEDVKKYLANGEMWVARKVLAGHSGEGIVIMDHEEDFVNAPLYTKYVKKRYEYRVHISNNGVFDIQRKAKRKDIEDDDVNWQVRNHDNGFIYMRGDNDETPDDVTEQAKKAFAVTGLDFAAIDVIYNSHEKKAYVLEVNTAPGLEGTTLENYSEMIGELE